MVTKAAPFIVYLYLYLCLYTCMYLSVSWSLPLSKPNKSLQVLPPDWQLWRATRLELHFAFHNINITGETSSPDSAMSPFTFPQTHNHMASNRKSCSSSLSFWLCSLLSNRECKFTAVGGGTPDFTFTFLFLLCIHLVIQKRHLCAWSTGSLEFGSFQLWTSVGCRGDQLVTRGRPTSQLYLLTFLWRTRHRQNMR